MDHLEAVANQLTEKHLLGELSEAENAEFELHYFSCAECAEDLGLALLLRDSARLVFAEEEQHQEQRVLVPAARVGWRERLSAFWRQPAFAVPALTSAALLALVFYQSAVLIPSYRKRVHAAVTAQAPLAFTLRQPSRGTTPQVSMPQGAEFVILKFDAAWDAQPASLHCTLTAEGAANSFSFDAQPPQPGESVNLLIPAGKLTPGRWTLDLQNGPGGAELSKYEFVFDNR
jgi:hypothetical protein